MKEKSKISVKAVMLTILLVVLLCGAAVGVWGLTRVWLEKVPIKNPYGYMDPDETKADPDEGITIDGILDEEEYQNNNWLYLHNGNGGSTVDIAMTSYYGEKGMYFVYDVTESTPIYVNLNRNNTLNSCVEMYLALSDVTNMNSSKLFEIDLMPTGDMVFKQRSARGSWYDVATTDDKMAYLGATTKGGKVNTEDCYGYYLEFFIPWDYMEWLGMDAASMKTDYVYVNPAHITSYNYEGTSTSNDRYWYSFASQHGASGLGMVSMYYKFDKNGAIGTVPVTFVEGEHYSITGVRSVIPGMKAYITITPEEGYALSSILVNGEEYIKKVSYNEDGSVNLYLKGTENGLTIAASAEKVTEGNKTLSGTVSLHKLGGDSFDGLSIGYKGPKGEKPITLDKNGRFVLENLAQGYYIITVEKDGYEPITRGICLNRDIDTELTLEYNLFTEASGWDIDKQNDGILTLIGGGNGTVKSYRQYTDVDLTVKVKAKPATADAGSGKTSVNFAFANGKTYSIRIGCNNSNTIVIQNRNNTIVSGWGVHYKLNDAERAKYESGGINLRILRNGTEVTVYLEDGKDRTKMNAVYSIDLSEHITVDTQATVAISHFEDEGERIDFPFTLTDKLNKVTLKLSDKNGRKVTTERKGYVVGDTVVVSADKGYYLVGMTVNGKAIDVDADGIGRFIAKGKNYTIETVTAKGVFRGTSGWNILKQHEGMLTLIGGGNGVIKSYDKHTDVDLTVKVKAEHAEADAGSGKTAITFLFDGNKKYSIRIGCNNSNKVVIQNRASSSDKSYVITGGKIHHTLSDAERAKYESDGINLRVLRNGTQVTVYLEDGMDSTKMNAVYSIDLSDKGIAADTLAEVRIEHFEDAGADIDFPFTFTDKLDKVTLKISDKNGKKITTERKSYVVGDTVVVSADEGYYLVGMTVNGKAINVDADGIGRFIAEGANYTIETVTAAKGVFRGTSGWNILKQHEGLLTLIGGGNGVIKSYDKYTDVDLTVKVKAEHAEADAGSGKTAITFLFDGNKKYSIRIGCNNSNKVVIQNRASSSDKSYVITGGKIHHTLSDAERAKYESDGINLRVLRNGTQVTVYLEDGMDSTKMNAVYSIDLSDKGIAADTLAEVRIEHFEDAGADIDFPFTFTDKLDKVTLKLSDKNGKTLTTERNSYVVGDTVVISTDVGYFFAKLKINGTEVALSEANNSYRFIAEKTQYEIETVVEKNMNFFYVYSGNWNLLQQNNGLLALNGGGDAILKSCDKHTDVDLKIKVKAQEAHADAGSGKTAITFLFDGNKKYSIRIGCNNSDNIVIQNRASSSDQSYVVSGSAVHHTLSDDERAKYESDGINLRVLRNGTQVTIYLEDGTDSAKMNAVYSIDLSDKGIAADTLAEVRIEHFGDVGVDIDYQFTLTDKLDKVTLNMSDKNDRTLTTERKSYVVGDTVVVSTDVGYYFAQLKINGTEVALSETNNSYRFTAEETQYEIETVVEKSKDLFYVYSGNWNLLQQNQGLLALNGGGDAILKSCDKHTDVDLKIKVKAQEAHADAGSGKTAITFLFDGNKKYSIRIGCNNSDNIVIQNRASSSDRSYVVSGSTVHHTLSDAERAKYESGGIDFRVLRNGTQVTIYLEDGTDSAKMNEVYSIDLSAYDIAADTPAEVRIEHFGDVGVDIDYQFTLTDKLDKVTLKMSDKNDRTLTTERTSYVVGDTVVVLTDASCYFAQLKVNGTEVALSENNNSYRFTAEETQYEIETVVEKKKDLFYVYSGNWNLLQQHNGLLVLNGGGDAMLKSCDKHTDVDLKIKVRAQEAHADAGSGKTAITFLFDGNKKYSIRIGCNNSDNIVIQNRATSSDKSYVVSGSAVHHTLSDAERAKYESAGINLRVLRNGTQVTIYLEDGTDSAKMNEVYSIDLSDKGIAADTPAEVRIEHFGDAGVDIDYPFTLIAGDSSTAAYSVKTAKSAFAQDDANQTGNGKTTLMEESKLLSTIYSVFLAIKRSIL